MAEYDDIIRRLFDEYELTRSEAEATGIRVDDPAKAKITLNQLKNKIRALGSVNLAAIEEYKEVSERYAFLSGQIADVEKSREELYHLIERLTGDMRRMFTEGFDKIAANFTTVFTELFGGGTAELRLSDPDHVLDSGIDILVQPPGKKVSSIELLSGGEKALIAVSIYFAIMKVNPPPFCMMDEVETALDDINVDRFAAYMQRMSGSTQFICISHRRGTMEAADMLYGVTMQEKGVSKLLALNVSELADALQIKYPHASVSEPCMSRERAAAGRGGRWGGWLLAAQRALRARRKGRFMGFFSKISAGLKKTRDSLVGAVTSMLGGFTKIDEELFEELEEILIMSDIGVATATHICDTLRGKVKEEKVSDPAEIRGMLETIIADMLADSEGLTLSTTPSVILVIGVNGAGKTTTIGKMAAQLKAEGKKVLLGAADTFRAAAIEQLAVWADRAGVEMIRGAEGSDPASVVFDTIAAAKARGTDVVICDTAGRLHNKKNLMDELAKISRIIDRELPGACRENLLVLDATTGQNAVNQAREFKTAADITGIVLTKLDGTARGGVVLSIHDELHIPVKYIGVGEQLDDLQPFDPAAFARAMFENEEKL